MEKLSFMYVYYYFSNPTVKLKNRLTIIITVYSRIKRQAQKQLMMVRPAHKQLIIFHLYKPRPFNTFLVSYIFRIWSYYEFMSGTPDIMLTLIYLEKMQKHILCMYLKLYVK